MHSFPDAPQRQRSSVHETGGRPSSPVTRSRLRGALLAFRWTAATGLHDLGNLGVPDAWANAANSDGSVIVGTSYDGSPTASAGPRPAGCRRCRRPRARRVRDGSVVTGGGWWTQSGGLQEPLPAPGGACCAPTRNVSPDGGVITGWASAPAVSARVPLDELDRKSGPRHARGQRERRRGPLGERRGRRRLAGARAGRPGNDTRPLRRRRAPLQRRHGDRAEDASTPVARPHPTRSCDHASRSRRTRRPREGMRPSR
jgi:hypothetical protein